jgi:hypothetical protein
VVGAAWAGAAATESAIAPSMPDTATRLADTLILLRTFFPSVALRRGISRMHSEAVAGYADHLIT